MSGFHWFDMRIEEDSDTSAACNSIEERALYVHWQTTSDYAASHHAWTLRTKNTLSWIVT